MGRLNVEGERGIHFESHAGVETPVVLVHGWGMSGRVWDPVLPALVDAGHAVVTFDQRACGRSDRDFADIGVTESAADLVAVVEKLGLDTVVLNGWSLGGAVAVQAAADLGARCVGVVLTSAASPRYIRAEDFPFGLSPGDPQLTIQALRADRPGLLREMSKGVFASPPDPAMVDWLWSIAMEAGPAGDRALESLARIDQREILAHLDLPVLSIVGDSDPYVDPGIGRAAAQIARRGQLLEVAACGHVPFLEHRALYCDALLGFLKAL